MKRGRGRPRKPPEVTTPQEAPAPVIGWGSTSADELPALLDDLQTVPEVAALEADKQRQLAALLLDALGFYRVGENLKGTRPYPHVDMDHEGNILGYRLPPGAGADPPTSPSPLHQ